MNAASGYRSLHLFEALGVELEYMIVDRETLDVKPLADRLLQAVAGSPASEVERGPIAWSNELVLHLLELKTNGPAPSADGLHEVFQGEVEEANRLLDEMGARLLPTAMHPWMDPDRETKLWPHENNIIYETYNRIFDCRGHGWANLQSTHINLPFSGDEEFGKLHAAIRVVLPLLPALAASSPLAGGRVRRQVDFRLEVYRNNSRAVPSVCGLVIPECVFSRSDYEEVILRKMYRDIAPHDPDNILQEEWLNSRGAIARFDRGSIEIRLLDVQECPLADLAIVRLVTDTVRALADERWCPMEELRGWNEKTLHRLLRVVIGEGEAAWIPIPAFLELFGMEGRSRCQAGEIWLKLFEDLYGGREAGNDPQRDALERMLERGTLSRRILARTGKDPGPDKLRSVYRELSECLAEGMLFL